MLTFFILLEMSRQRLRESSVQWNIVLTLDSFSFKILKLAEEQAISNKIKNVNIKVSEKVCKNIKEQFDDELLYCKNKHKLQLNFIYDNSLIIPEYKIELLNKNKKIIKILEYKLKPTENLNYRKLLFRSVSGLNHLNFLCKLTILPIINKVGGSISFDIIISGSF